MISGIFLSFVFHLFMKLFLDSFFFIHQYLLLEQRNKMMKCLMKDINENAEKFEDVDLQLFSSSIKDQLSSYICVFLFTSLSTLQLPRSYSQAQRG